MTDLLGCPFCGLQPEYNERNAWCRGRSSAWHNLVNMTIEDWNRRVSASQQVTDLKWLRDQVVALCEDTEERCASTASREYETKMGAFARGRIHEAKGIRNAICEVVRERLTAALSAKETT